MPKRSTIFLVITLGVSALAGACGTAAAGPADAGSSNPGTPCVPGQQVACPCAGGGATGVQACGSDGHSFGLCMGCGSASDASSSDTGPNRGVSDVGTLDSTISPVPEGGGDTASLADTNAPDTTQDDTGATDSNAPPPDDAPGGVTGMYACTLTGTAEVSILGGAPGPQTLPLDGEMTVTESGSAISAVLVAEGGMTCSIAFTDQGGGAASINAGQSCMFVVQMPLPNTTVTISFVAAAGDDAGPPGTAALVGTTLTPNLPFNLSAAGGLGVGTGILTGSCAKM